MKISHAIESEKAVLGGLLLDPNLIDQINDELLPRDFDNRFHGEIFESMRKLSDTRKGFDIPMIIDDLNLSEKHQKYILDLANECPTTKNIKAHADIIREKSVQRQLIKVAKDIVKEAMNPDETDIHKILNNAEKRVMEIAVKENVDICPAQTRLAMFLEEFAAEVKVSDLTEEYLRECIVEVNKALVMTLHHFEDNNA